MATQTIEFGCESGGTVPTVKLYAAGSDTVVATSSTAVEQTNRLGVWVTTFTDIAAGEYRLIATISGDKVADWWVTLTLTTTTFQCYDFAGVQTVSAGATTTIQSGLATAATQTTILARLGSWTGSGLNTILGAFRAIAAKAAALTPTDISSGTTFDNTTDAVEAIRDRGDAAWVTGSAGGDATLAKQNEILTYLTGGQVESSSPVVDPSTIELTEGDRYDGTRRPKLAWTVAKDYTGATITLTIWDTDEDDLKVVYFTGAGVVTSSTLINVTMTADFLVALEYSGCPPISQHRFDLIATAAGNDETIAWGEAYIYQRSD